MTRARPFEGGFMILIGRVGGAGLNPFGGPWSESLAGGADGGSFTLPDGFDGFGAGSIVSVMVSSTGDIGYVVYSSVS